MKHVDVKYRFIQESIRMEEIGVRCLSTKLNWADVLTKALVPNKHKDAYSNKEFSPLVSFYDGSTVVLFRTIPMRPRNEER
jgi:hypothetical protein